MSKHKKRTRDSDPRPGPKTKTEITRAELSTILAGLRTWQALRYSNKTLDSDALIEIADENGEVVDKKVDALCEQLNGSDLIEVLP